MKAVIANLGIAILFVSAIIGGITDNDVITIIPTAIGLSLLSSVTF